MKYLVLLFLIGIPMYAVFLSFVVWIPNDSTVVIITRKRNGSHRIARCGVTFKWPVLEARSKQICMERRDLLFEFVTASSEGVNFNLTVMVTGTLADQASTLLTIANGASTASRGFGRRSFGSLAPDLWMFAQQQLTVLIGRTPATEVAAEVAVIARELARAINDQTTRLGIEDVSVLIPSAISDERFEEAVRHYHELLAVAKAQATRAMVEATEFAQAFGAIMKQLQELQMSDERLLATASELMKIWTDFQERHYGARHH